MDSLLKGQKTGSLSSPIWSGFSLPNYAFYIVEMVRGEGWEYWINGGRKFTGGEERVGGGIIPKGV